LLVTGKGVDTREIAIGKNEVEINVGPWLGGGTFAMRAAGQIACRIKLLVRVISGEKRFGDSLRLGFCVSALIGWKLNLAQEIVEMAYYIDPQFAPTSPLCPVCV